MIAHEVIDAMTKDKRFKAALEEMAQNPLSEIGTPTISSTFTANLDAGAKTVRISIAMIPEGEMFSEDLSAAS
jgi:hypothetical protein